MRKFLTTCVVFATACTSFGQLGAGARLGYDIYFGGTGLKTLSIGAFGSYAPRNEYLLRFGFQYGLPVKFTETYYAYAYESTTQPNSIEVEGTSKVGTMNLYFDGVRYFGDGDYDYGGFYGVVGAGLTIATEKTTFASFSSDYYLPGYSESEKSIYFQPMIRLFLGYDLGLDPMHVYFEGGLSIPAAQVNSQTGSTATLPAFAEISAGIRF